MRSLNGRKFRTFAVILPAIVLSSYFAVPAWLLHSHLDRLVFVGNAGAVASHQDREWSISAGPDRSVLVRLYGDDQSNRCAVFFPGQHGGIPDYEQKPFAWFRMMGVAVYALSYPGYDGATGSAQVSTLIPDVGEALSYVDAHTACRLSNAVFVGRSLGATVAVASATKFRPRGILLDGASPGLADAVRAFMRRRAITRPWTLLPVEALVRDEYRLVPQLRRLSTVPVRIFQGTADDVTPFKDISVAVKPLPNVSLIPVPGGAHSDSYILAKEEYLRQLSSLLGD